jgi:ketosteroid isomerase-like protein
MVAAEQGLDRSVMNSDVAKAGALFMSDDCLLFYPFPVRRGELTEPLHAPPEIIEEWEPDFGDISEGGEMGYVTGSWTYRMARGDTAVNRGEYVNVWKRQEDGNWKLALHMATAHWPPQSQGDGTIHRRRRGRKNNHLHFDTTALASLAEDDSLLAVAVRTRGAAQTSLAVVDSEARFFRSMSQPFIGRETVSAMPELTGEGLIVHQQGADVAPFGDLGFTYGTYGRDQGKGSGGYLRIWRRNGHGEWRIMVDAQVPMPEEYE